MVQSKKTKLKYSYKDIFDNSPAAILVLDYSPLLKLANQLKKQTVTNPRKFLMENSALVKKTFLSSKLLETNKAALELYGAKSKRELWNSFSKIFITSATDLLVEQYVALLNGEAHFEGEFKCKSARRMFRDVFLSLSVPREARKTLSRVIINLQDITTWKKLERQLRKRAKLDGLTQLLNHSAIVERLEEELIRAKRYGLSLSCFMIDLDFFKVINDKFGHPRGDKILRRVSRMIKNCFRKADVIGRYGGDEFLVILPETKLENSKYAAYRLQKVFAGAIFKYKRMISFHITLSIGIAGYPHKNIKDAKDLIALADKAMYQCKMDGRNRITIAS